LESTGNEEPDVDSGDPKLLNDVKRHLLGGGHVFLTGAAGVGKTYFVKRLVASLAREERMVTITASTGIAATLLFDEVSGSESPWIRGPSTLHSAARLPLSYDDDTPARCERGRQLLHDTDVLIVDEISMTDSRTFDCLMKRVSPGMGILAVGDFFQLPPISEDDDGEPNFAFRSVGFTDFKVVELTRVYRQDEPEFIRFLEGLRHGRCDRRFYAGLRQEFDFRHPVLFGTRREAAEHNQRQIEKIASPSVIATFHVEVGDEEEAIRWFDSYTRAVRVLELKRGMRVLCIRNHEALVNGDLGTITDIADEASVCGPA
jgi:ATP-dependent exoDNAse (exonuclease V) alpha subunit